jgi:hypothetical protein
MVVPLFPPCVCSVPGIGLGGQLTGCRALERLDEMLPVVSML